ncbi:hypothetical protein [Nocardioides houyundeii]|uniref:hypothetical protein n=1 Tax=Nocardioides houyundeii TaxID=2045452 RepID=UPI001315AD2E|nr:hypothetical protein [Nocardioides houyundeii]
MLQPAYGVVAGPAGFSSASVVVLAGLEGVGTTTAQAASGVGAGGWHTAVASFVVVV